MIAILYIYVWGTILVHTHIRTEISNLDMFGTLPLNIHWCIIIVWEWLNIVWNVLYSTSHGELYWKVKQLDSFWTVTISCLDIYGDLLSYQGWKRIINILIISPNSFLANDSLTEKQHILKTIEVSMIKFFFSGRLQLLNGYVSRNKLFCFCKFNKLRMLLLLT